MPDTPNAVAVSSFILYLTEINDSCRLDESAGAEALWQRGGEKEAAPDDRFTSLSVT